MHRRLCLSVSFGLLTACGSSQKGAGVDAGKPGDAHADAHAHASDGAMDGRGHATDASDAAPSIACKLEVPTPPSWRLVTDGPVLKDGLGRIVFLRGVNAGERSKFAPYVPFDYSSADGGYSAALEAYMAHAQGWGIDAMRVPFTWDALEPTRTTPPTYSASWLAQYTALLTSAWQHGIYTIVDFHQDIYAQVFCGDGFPAWTLPSAVLADAGPPRHDCPGWSLEYFDNAGVEAAFDAFWPSGSPTMTAYVAAWDEMISQVADLPGVIGFEPINEPSSGTADENTFEATTLTAFYTAMAAEMNAKAPSSLVFFDPTGLDGAMVSTVMGKPMGQNLVFAPHFYPIEHAAASDVQTQLGNWAGYAQMWNVPVWVGEFGASNLLPTTPSYMQWVFSGLDALPLVGGTEWDYSDSTELWNSESDSVTWPDGGDGPVAVAVVRPFARAVAGTAVTQSYDADGTLAYTLSYTATDGVTEVRRPAPGYHVEGVVVRVSGGCYDSTTVPGEVLVQAPAGASVTLTITPIPPMK